jgi:hypothetical protein
MRAVRDWSIRHARTLHKVYALFEQSLVLINPILKRVGYDRLDRPFAKVEQLTKGLLFDSKSCGQCTLGATGLSCPMNCPKTIRNGPCGGVRQDGGCEVKPEMTCVWVKAWEGSQRIGAVETTIQVIQPPVDNRLQGRSAWLRALRQRLGSSS